MDLRTYLTTAKCPTFNHEGIESMEQADAVIAEYQAETDTVKEAQELLHKLSLIKANGTGASAEFLILAANEALSAIPELQLDAVSMESTEAGLTTEVAMEGIGDIMKTIGKTISKTFNKMKKTTSKLGKALAFKFKDTNSKLEALDSRFATHDVVTEDVAIAIENQLFLQGDGIKLDPVKAIADWTALANRYSSFSPVNETIALLKASKWTDLDTALSSIFQATSAYLDRMGQTTEDGKKLMSVKNPAIIVYATPEGAPGGFQQTTVMERKATLNSYYQTLVSISKYTDTAKVVSKAGVQTISAIPAKGIKAILHNLNSVNILAGDNLSMFHAQLNEAYDLVVGEYNAKIDGLELTTEQYHLLARQTMNLIHHMQYALMDFFNFQISLTSAYIEVLNKHFK